VVHGRGSDRRRRRARGGRAGGLALGDPAIPSGLTVAERPAARPDAADVTVVVCTYSLERWAELAAAIGSLERQTVRPREVVLVVDHAAALLERARRRWPGVTAIASAGPPGLSSARNTGLDASSGAVVAFLDDDAVAEPDWLERMLDAYRDPSVMGAGGAVHPLWRSARPSWFPAEFDWVVGCTYRGMPPGRAPVRNVIGASMSFRRDVLVEAGGFRAALGRVGSRPLGCEETELCIRARRMWPAREVLYDPRIEVRHAVPAGRATFRYFAARCYAEGRSKAAVARLVGDGPGLSSERRYVTRTLPAAVLRGLADGLARRDGGGPQRAGAVLVGLAAATAGYWRGRLAATPVGAPAR
jgi:hypothetical protein